MVAFYKSPALGWDGWKFNMKTEFMKHYLANTSKSVLQSFWYIWEGKDREMYRCSQLPSQMTLASSLCLQLWDPIPRCLQSLIDDSVPVHAMSSNQIGPVPCPKCAFVGADTAGPQPSCLQTTWASLRPQLSSHTVPHWLLWRISTLPEQLLLELTSLTVAGSGRKESTITVNPRGNCCRNELKINSFTVTVFNHWIIELFVIQ